jgi:hypothetical protein
MSLMGRAEPITGEEHSNRGPSLQWLKVRVVLRARAGRPWPVGGPSSIEVLWRACGSKGGGPDTGAEGLFRGR